MSSFKNYDELYKNKEQSVKFLKIKKLLRKIKYLENQVKINNLRMLAATNHNRELYEYGKRITLDNRNIAADLIAERITMNIKNGNIFK